MTAAFASRISRINAAVFRHLVDVDALLDGQPVQGVFDKEYVEVLDGISSAYPTLSLPSALTASVTRASSVVIGATTYRVRSPHPDGEGITRLILEAQ